MGRELIGAAAGDNGQVSVLAGTMRRSPGGTANLAVLGGNLPPSFGTANARIDWGGLGAVQAAGESPAATGRWPVPPKPRPHRSALECADGAQRSFSPPLSESVDSPQGCNVNSRG